MPKYYSINFKKLGLLLLPPFLRRPRLSALTYALLVPIASLHNRFRSLLRNTKYRLNHNGQVCYLRAVLNDQFDPAEGGRIEIVEFLNDRQPTSIYNRNEERSPHLHIRENGNAMTITQRGYGGINSYDFWISVPDEIYYDEEKKDRIKAVVSMYKLASKRFQIIPK